MDIVIRPLSTYPGQETRVRRRGTFRVGFDTTRRLLERELRYLGARGPVVIEADFAESDLRRDGWPKAAAVARSPRVVLSFDSKHGPLRYPCDTYLHWTDNMRAIALALEALRAVDRYGVTRKGEQYTGWKALPASTNGAGFTVETAARFIVAKGNAPAGALNFLLNDPERFQGFIRQAQRRCHPDAGGNTEDFDLVQKARAVLYIHHGLTP